MVAQKNKNIEHYESFRDEIALKNLKNKKIETENNKEEDIEEEKLEESDEE